MNEILYQSTDMLFPMNKPKDISIEISSHENLLRKSLYEALLKAIEEINDTLINNRTPLRILDVGSGRENYCLCLLTKDIKRLVLILMWNVCN